MHVLTSLAHKLPTAVSNCSSLSISVNGVDWNFLGIRKKHFQHDQHTLIPGGNRSPGKTMVSPFSCHSAVWPYFPKCNLSLQNMPFLHELQKLQDPHFVLKLPSSLLTEVEVRQTHYLLCSGAAANTSIHHWRANNTLLLWVSLHHYSSTLIKKAVMKNKLQPSEKAMELWN